MYVCVYVSVCICMYACMDEWILYVCLYVCIVYEFTVYILCMYVCIIYIRICYIYICMYVLCIYYVCIHACMYACVYVCMYVCMYVWRYCVFMYVFFTYICMYLRMSLFQSLCNKSCYCPHTNNLQQCNNAPRTKSSKVTDDHNTFSSSTGHMLTLSVILQHLHSNTGGSRTLTSLVTAPTARPFHCLSLTITAESTQITPFYSKFACSFQQTVPPNFVTSLYLHSSHMFSLSHLSIIYWYNYSPL